MPPLPRLIHLKACQALAADRLAQLQKSSSFDLSNPLARDAIAAGHFVQGSRPAISQAEAQLDHFPLARRQGPQDLKDAFAEQVMIDGLGRTGGVRIAEKI